MVSPDNLKGLTSQLVILHISRFSRIPNLNYQLSILSIIHFSHGLAIATRLPILLNFFSLFRFFSFNSPTRPLTLKESHSGIAYRTLSIFNYKLSIINYFFSHFSPYITIKDLSFLNSHISLLFSPISLLASSPSLSVVHFQLSIFPYPFSTLNSRISLIYSRFFFIIQYQLFLLSR